jgi:hypothetical protein
MMGCTKAHEDSHNLPTAETQVQPQVKSYGSVVLKAALGQGFLRVYQFPYQF